TFAALDTLLRKLRRMAVSLFAPLSPRMTQFANRYAVWSNRSEDSFWCTSRPRSKPVSSAIARVFTPRRAPASSRRSPVFHIGMTGLGGGVLLLPLLIFGLNVPPILAVGSDAVFNFITKIGSGWMHLRKGTVRRKVVMALATGSIPGSIVGVGFLAHLRHVYG